MTIAKVTARDQGKRERDCHADRHVDSCGPTIVAMGMFGSAWTFQSPLQVSPSIGSGVSRFTGGDASEGQRGPVSNERSQFCSWNATLSGAATRSAGSLAMSR